MHNAHNQKFQMPNTTTEKERKNTKCRKCILQKKLHNFLKSKKYRIFRIKKTPVREG